VKFIVPSVLIVTWFASTSTGAIKSYQLASPQAVFIELNDLAARGVLWTDLGASVERVALGFALGASIAIVLGSLVGASRTAQQLLDPTLQAMRSVPSLAWVPLLLLWLGIGETAKITLVAIGAFFPVYVALASAIRDVDRKLVEVARVLGVRGGPFVTRVLLPAALPQLLVGLRISLTQAWLFLVAAELLGASRGLGFLLTDGQQIARTDEILVAILAFAVCGKLSEAGMRVIERRLVGWTDTVVPG
jgi:sulfonate transport system permease protein